MYIIHNIHEYTYYNRIYNILIHTVLYQQSLKGAQLQLCIIICIYIILYTFQYMRCPYGYNINIYYIYI